MKKNERISAHITQLTVGKQSTLPAPYLAYFTCFNAQEYYDAHDVLEHLWLRGRDENYAFFKGLIQIAGAFVHLQKQQQFPDHPKHATRMQPAVRLFRLGLQNLENYGDGYWQLDLAAVREMCQRYVDAILSSDFRLNPWRPETAPQLDLRPE